MVGFPGYFRFEWGWYNTNLRLESPDGCFWVDWCWCCFSVVREVLVLRDLVLDLVWCGMLFLAFVGFGWDCRLVIVFLAEITIVVGCSQIVGGRYTGFGTCVDWF